MMGKKLQPVFVLIKYHLSQNYQIPHLQIILFLMDSKLIDEAMDFL